MPPAAGMPPRRTRGGIRLLARLTEPIRFCRISEVTNVPVQRTIIEVAPSPLLEVMELVKAMEEKFISAAAR
jgi:hypothetical protein